MCLCVCVSFIWELATLTQSFLHRKSVARVATARANLGPVAAAIDEPWWVHSPLQERFFCTFQWWSGNPGGVEGAVYCTSVLFTLYDDLATPGEGRVLFTTSMCIFTHLYNDLATLEEERVLCSTSMWLFTHVHDNLETLGEERVLCTSMCLTLQCALAKKTHCKVNFDLKMASIIKN